MHLFPIFRWLELTWLGTTIRMSTYLFPAIEVVHLFGLVLLLGTLVVVDMRMLGLGMRRQTVSQVFVEFSPLTATGIGLMLSGIPLFLSEAIKCYENDGFRMKMLFFSWRYCFTSPFIARLPRLTKSERRGCRSPGFCRCFSGLA